MYTCFVCSSVVLKNAITTLLEYRATCRYAKACVELCLQRNHLLDVCNKLKRNEKKQTNLKQNKSKKILKWHL